MPRVRNGPWHGDVDDRAPERNGVSIQSTLVRKQKLRSSSASGDSDTVLITFTASDGIKTSNVASPYIDGYQIKTDPQTGGTYIQYDQFPWRGGNIRYIWGG